MPEYNQLTDSIAKELIGIFGAANVYYNDAPLAATLAAVDVVLQAQAVFIRINCFT